MTNIFIKFILILSLLLVGVGADKCNKKGSSENQNSNSVKPEKSVEEKIADFRRQAAQYRHRIENGLLRFVEFKREIKKNGKLTASQDLALNETLSKINDKVNALGEVIEKVDISKLSFSIQSIDEINNLIGELENSLVLFVPENVSSTIKTVSATVRTALSGLRLLLVTTEKEIGNG